MTLALPTLPSFPMPASPAPIPPASDPGPTLLSFQARMKLDEAIATADHAQARLNLFLESVPLPTAAQLADLTQAIWRLTAVRKTIYLIAIGKYSYKGVVPFPKGLKKNIRILEEAVSLLCPPRPALAAFRRCGSGASPRLSTGLPSLDGNAPRLRLRRRGPQKLKPAPESNALTDPMWHGHPARDLSIAGPESNSLIDSVLESSHSELDSSAPCNAPACPELRAPLNTAQAAARQADQLCEQAGLPAPETTTEIPTPAPRLPDSSLDIQASGLGTVDSGLLSEEDGPNRGRRELPPLMSHVKRSAAGGNMPIFSRPSAAARSRTPSHAHDPPHSPVFSRYSLLIVR